MLEISLNSAGFFFDSFDINQNHIDVIISLDVEYVCIIENWNYKFKRYVKLLLLLNDGMHKSIKLLMIHVSCINIKDAVCLIVFMTLHFYHCVSISLPKRELRNFDLLSYVILAS